MPRMQGSNAARASLRVGILLVRSERDVKCSDCSDDVLKCRVCGRCVFLEEAGASLLKALEVMAALKEWTETKDGEPFYQAFQVARVKALAAAERYVEQEKEA